MSASSTQSVTRRRGVRFTVACGDVACRVTPRVVVALSPGSVGVKGTAVTLLERERPTTTATFSAALRKRISRAIAAGRTVRATLTLTAVDADRDQAQRSVTVRLTR